MADRWLRSGRLAAWIALLAAAAAVATLVMLLLTDLAAVLAVIAALSAVGAAAWVVLARRGFPRLLAAAAILVALAVAAVVLIAREAAADLAALAAALAVFVLATAAALRGAAGQRAAGPTRAGGPEPGGRAVLLMNPKSGGGKVERFRLADEARRRGIEPMALSPGDDLQALAREAAGRAEVIGMAGGDGSQALVAQVAMAHDIPFVCVPAGTRNHLAQDLGLDRDDVVGALDAFAAGVERRIDVGLVNGRVFVNNVSLGIYAEIVQSEAYREAKLETVQRQLPDLLGPRSKPFDLRFVGPGGEERGTAQLLLVSNNPYRLDRLAGAGSRPRLDSGLLGIIAVQVAGSAAAAELVALEAVGQVRRSSSWLEWSSPTFEVASGGPVAAGVDGEALLLEPPLRFEVAPAALRIRMPPAASGLSPAALSPGFSRTTLARLWRIAAGRS